MERRKFLDQAGRVGAVFAIAPGLITGSEAGKVGPEPEPTFEEKLDTLITKWGPAIKDRGYTDTDITRNRQEAIEVKDEKVAQVLKDHEKVFMVTQKELDNKIKEVEEYVVGKFEQFAELIAKGRCNSCGIDDAFTKNRRCPGCERRRKIWEKARQEGREEFSKDIENLLETDKGERVLCRKQKKRKDTWP